MEIHSDALFRALSTDRSIAPLPSEYRPRLPNIWMGVSVESAKYCHRIDHLRSTGSRIKFLSLEPLPGPLEDLSLSGIYWVIVGGESGPQARPMDADWVTDIRDQCRQAGVPFFFKQWGGRNKKKSGRLLQGSTWDQVPRLETLQRSQAREALRIG